MFACRYVRGKRVLDLATGIGYGAEMLSRLGEASSVTGVDCSEEAIAFASGHYSRPGLAFMVGDALRLGFTDAGFDVVVSLETIEHIADYSCFLDEVSRVLGKDGVLVISTPNLRYDSRNPLHVSAFTIEEFSAALLPRFEHVDMFGQEEMSTSARLIARVNRLGGLFLPGLVLRALSRTKNKLVTDDSPEILHTVNLYRCRNLLAVCEGVKHGDDDDR